MYVFVVYLCLNLRIVACVVGSLGTVPVSYHVFSLLLMISWIPFRSVEKRVHCKLYLHLPF